MTTPEQPVNDEAKQTLIDDITQADQKAFEEVLRTGKHHQQFELPNDALRYLLIPRRVLELAQDPLQIAIMRPAQSAKALAAMVVEHRKEQVGNWESLKRYDAVLRETQDASIPLPADVDKFHAELFELIEAKEMSLHDYLMHEVSLVISGKYPQRLHIEAIETRQRNGIGTSFYQRLHFVAPQLGFQFITGVTEVSKVHIYTEKFGRYPLSQIRPDKRDVFENDYYKANPDLYTIDFLREEDKKEYLI